MAFGQAFSGKSSYLQNFAEILDLVEYGDKIFYKGKYIFDVDS